MSHYVTTMRATDGNVIKLECHDALPSTSRLAKQYAKLGYPDRYVVFAEGKKKLDADGKYHGDVEHGVYMSCILRPSIFPSQAALISALSAVAMSTALEEHTTHKIGIGWVSKIYCDGKLIGDVTIEGKLDNFTSYEFIVVTFSAALSNENFPPRLTDLIRKVFESDNSSVYVIIAKTILNNFFPLYANIKNRAKFMDIYRQKFIMRGQKIRYASDEGRQKCKVLGVNEDDCALIVENPHKKVVKIYTPNKVTVPKKISIK